jgi:DNA-binding response OmpR family regulator
MRILLIEDNTKLAWTIKASLEQQDYCVDVAGTAGQGDELAVVEHYDAIILDVMLPDGGGVEVCRELRRQKVATPILMLTALSSTADKVAGLDAGADDYLTKPFDLEELFARVRAILRRTRPSLETLTIGSITVDFRSRLAVRDNTDLRLTHKEFEILHYLAERQGHVVHRDELLKDLWGYAQAPFTRSVDTAMARLRKKIESDAHHPRFIHTVHGDGYCLTPHGQTTV